MKQLKTVTAFGLAAAMVVFPAVSAAYPLTVYAETTVADSGMGAEAPPEGYDEETWQRLNDSHLEYDELEALIVNFNPTYLAANQQGERSINYAAYEQAAVDMRTAADEMVEDMEQELDRKELEAPTEEDMRNDPEGALEYSTEQYTLSATIEGTRQAAKEMEKAVELMRRSLDRSLDTTVKEPLVKGAESMLVAHGRLAYATELADASVVLAQEAYDSAVTRQSLGMATTADVIAAQEGLASARAQQDSTNYQLNQVKQNICLMTGWEYNAEVVIGAVPDPDPNRITGMNPEADAVKAIGNNNTLIGMRSSGSAGTTVAQKNSHLAQMDEIEEKITLGVDQLYQDILRTQAVFQAASSAYESADRTYAAAQRQYELGMVSQLEYRQLNVAFLSQKMSFENAKLDFFQALENYDWAIEGQLDLE